VADDCVIFANRHKYTLNNEKDDDYDQGTEQQEQLVLEASKHVEMARAQQLLFVGKKEHAKST
jgi:hypothetical protein